MVLSKRLNSLPGAGKVPAQAQLSSQPQQSAGHIQSMLSLVPALRGQSTELVNLFYAGEILPSFQNSY